MWTEMDCFGLDDIRTFCDINGDRSKRDASPAPQGPFAVELGALQAEDLFKSRGHR
jgi:hypothetical protein